MASSTTNLDLILPVGGENVSRQIINANSVKIDEAVGAVPSGTDLQSQVNALNNNITNLSDSIGTVPSGETVEGQITTLNNNFVNSFGELATGITYQKYGKIVIIYFNGNTVSNSSGWTDLLTLPANLGQSRYTVHAKTMSGHDARIGSGNVISYRGSAGDMFGTIVYIMS